MTLTNHVSGTISLDSVGVALDNFHVPILVSYNADAWGAQRKRSYTDLAGVKTDFPSTTGPEYLFASRFFGQTPHGQTLAIGRGALKPTQKFTLVPTVRDSYTFRLNVGGDGATTKECTFTSDASATLAEICTGVMDAINTVVGKNFTATGGVTDVVVTADAAGEWFWIEVQNPEDFTIVEDHADPGIATDLAAILTESDDWYALVTTHNSDALVKAAADWANSNKKIYVFDTVETEALLEAADGTQGTLDDIDALAYNGVLGIHHPRPADMVPAGILGKWLAYEPGAAVVYGKTITGATAQKLTSTYRTNLVDRDANFYETVAGAGRFFDGSVGGTYAFIDVKRNVDYMENLIQTRCYAALVGAPIVPMDDEGIGIVEAALRGVADELVAMRILRSDPAPVVSVPKASAISAADKAARILRNVKISGELAGAVQKIIYTASVTF